MTGLIFLPTSVVSQKNMNIEMKMWTTKLLERLREVFRGKFTVLQTNSYHQKTCTFLSQKTEKEKWYKTTGCKTWYLKPQFLVFWSFFFRIIYHLILASPAACGQHAGLETGYSQKICHHDGRTKTHPSFMGTQCWLSLSKSDQFQF